MFSIYYSQLYIYVYVYTLQIRIHCTDNESGNWLTGIYKVELKRKKLKKTFINGDLHKETYIYEYVTNQTPDKFYFSATIFHAT